MMKLPFLSLVAIGLTSCITPYSYPVASEATDPNPPSLHKSAPKPSASPFIGLTETQAGLQADKLNVRHRIVQRDGQSFPVTMDYNESRLNFAIANGRVIRVTKG